MADLPPLREVIARHGLGARRSLGQHFLLDLNLTGRIARAAGDLARGTTIEIGPGPGGLTRSLLAAGAGFLVVVEKDSRCVAALEELGQTCPGRLVVVQGDALEVDVASLGPPPRRIVANLPYNVSTALLVKWLSDLARTSGLFERLVLMFQKEVALRLVASPGSKSYGRLSVLTRWLTEPRTLFDIGPKAFTPPPKVTSTVLELVTRDEPLAPADPEALQRVTAAAFGQRRKMLRQSLKSLQGSPETLLEEAEVSPTARAETLSVEQFCALARAYTKGR